MARVTEDEVKEIIDTDVSDITAFITAANLLVTAVLDGQLLDAHLKEIERWLSAHFVAVRDPRATEEKIGDATVKYALGSNTYTNSNKGVPGLNATPYGQQVMLLDSTGLLAERLNKRPASFAVLG